MDYSKVIKDLETRKSLNLKIYKSITKPISIKNNGFRDSRPKLSVKLNEIPSSLQFSPIYTMYNQYKEVKSINNESSNNISDARVKRELNNVISPFARKKDEILYKTPQLLRKTKQLLLYSPIQSKSAKINKKDNKKINDNHEIGFLFLKTAKTIDNSFPKLKSLSRNKTMKVYDINTNSYFTDNMERKNIITNKSYQERNLIPCNMFRSMTIKKFQKQIKKVIRPPSPIPIALRKDSSKFDLELKLINKLENVKLKELMTIKRTIEYIDH